MASLSKAKRKVLGEYLRDVADKLNLRDWTVTVMHASPQDVGSAKSYLAEVRSDPGAWEAKFYFRPDFAALEPGTVRETCVHELIHVHRRAIQHLNSSNLKDTLSVDSWNHWLSAYELLDEYATEALTLAIAPLMPAFPGWPGKGKS